MPVKESEKDIKVDDLDDDLDDEHEESGTGGEHEPNQDDDSASEKDPGTSDDGSVTVEIDEEDENTIGSDANLSASGDPEDAELLARREARRQERQERKQKQKEKEERIQRELAQEREARRQLETRLAAIERRNNGAEVAQIDNVLKQTKDAEAYFSSELEDAITKNDGKRAAEATKKMMLAQERIKQIENVKKATQKQANAPAPLDERLVNHANDFMKRNSWYRPDGQDNDSTLMRTIDNMVAGEGWDPTTREYWQELDERVKKYLPHRAKGAKVTTTERADDEQRQTTTTRSKPKSVVGGAGSGTTTGASGVKTKYTLSAARVQAIKDANMWDDPVARNEMIRTYRDYDKANKGGK